MTRSDNALDYLSLPVRAPAAVAADLIATAATCRSIAAAAARAGHAHNERHYSAAADEAEARAAVLLGGAPR